MNNSPNPIVRLTGSLLALLGLLFLAGCASVGPDFEIPDTAVAEQWVDADDAMISNQPADHPEWWKVFNDPVLDQLVETAQSQNLTLRSAGLRVLQAHAQLGIVSGNKYPLKVQPKNTV